MAKNDAALKVKDLKALLENYGDEELVYVNVGHYTAEYELAYEGSIAFDSDFKKEENNA